ncbi:MAG TPA: hypothetical protein VG986_23290 [Pseudolabrys sp.]|nr:hypothetical protein [Pseudolabrys sp.]
MKKVSVAVLSSLLAAAPLSLAYAAKGRVQDLQAQMMLLRLQHSLQNSPGPVSPATTAARNGTIVVRATFTKQSNYTGTLFCTGAASHTNATTLDVYRVSKTVPVKFSGNTGTCTVSMPYSWQHADTTQQILASLSIFSENCTCTTSEVDLENDWNGLEAKLPGNGVTTTFDFGTLPF